MDRRQAGRIGGLRRAARYTSDELKQFTANARRGFHARFEREVDPAGVLSASERQRRAEAAKRAYMLSLAAKSADARRAKAAR